MATFSSSSSSNDPPPPSFWTHVETISLIENYSEKWQSLDRGDLSVADWQSVADSIAWQCEQDPPLETATRSA
ncbi:hypothetical protein QJS10_CPA10g01029 [Acorus calamus]|uniref:Uncharacterized protein n=1 Tax=Acorus calamus TaxID=4465 RepID=A0AAV9DYW6_ACOCL|nr:hypothetical protein QJS10_CPA10g01029 [Acorus calamus]